MSQMDNVRVFFVLPEGCSNQDECSDIMLQAYEACRQNVVSVSWVQEGKLESISLTKSDFVVFQTFEGKNFETFKESKCARILGPWCLFVCVMKGYPIPNFTWPIYNVAMKDCVVSCSHIPKAKKLEIKEKVKMMGGCYSDSLLSTNTHLVTESVKSEKYLQAAESGVKLMVSTWVDAVWEASQTKNIHCDNEEFNKYKCLPLHNLTISSTGLPSMEVRKQVASTVAKNGGIFTGNLVLTKTDVLIVYGESGISSNKYKAARSNENIYCVSLDWINDSIAKGYALPHTSYTVNKKATSTPTKERLDPNFSTISAIGDVTARQATTLEETMLPKKPQPTILFSNRISPNKRKCSTSIEVDRLVDGLDIKKAKRAGQYLDGCSVYLAGFKHDQREKLSKILNLSGATRYDDITDRLTHIIVGDTTCAEVKIIKSKNYSVSLVSLHWLLDSMEKQQIADEEDYLINLHDSDREQFNSPLGRKGLSLLRTNKTLTSDDMGAASTSKKDEGDDVEERLMQQYLNPLGKDDETDTLVQLMKNNSGFNSKPDLTSDSKHTTDISSQESQDDRTSQDTNIFDSKKFIIVNFSAEEYQLIKEQIESVLGTVMSKTYKGIPDYIVAPAFIKTPIQMSALEVVNQFWILESIQECEELPIAYYHRPFVVTDCKPLANCVVTISGYSASERNFLKELIEALGGLAQEQFARISSVEKNVKASTHLVSLEAGGKKYTAALKWGLPVVNKDWLFECAKNGKLEPEEKFLMGDSKAPNRSSSSESTNRPSNSKNTPLKTTLSINSGTPSTSAKSKPSTPSSSSLRKVLTPLSQIPALDINKSASEKTPVNQRLFQGAAETPFSQVTPINKLMEEVRKTNLLGTPQTPPVPKTWYDVDTPESPFGAFIRPHLSPKSKKELMRYINHIPEFVPPPNRKNSTPLSVVKRRCWAKLLGQQESPSRFPEDRTQASDQMEPDISQGDIVEPNVDENAKEPVNHDSSATNSEEAFINTKLKQLEEMVNVFGESRRTSRAFQATVSTEAGNHARDTQPFTVGWDYEEDIQPPREEFTRIFIISGIENDQRQTIVNKIESLGGQVSELNTYDPKCTHLICSKPARNEKTLSCMASGKWILHMSYVDKCVAAGKFLPEEDYEFGNPKSKENIKMAFDKDDEFKLQSIHWWRKEISRRGYGAFNDMRAIVVAQKRDPIIRVIEAGGGQIVDATPPFTDNIHATHCLLEVRSVPDFTVYTPLAQQGILCINTLYISEFLYRTNKDIKDAVLPHFSRFYS